MINSKEEFKEIVTEVRAENRDPCLNKELLCCQRIQN